MSDPRKPRAFKPRGVAVLVADGASFNRNLTGEILRNLNVTDVHSARNEEVALNMLLDRRIDIVLLAWDDSENQIPALDFIRKLRRMDDDRIRRLPVILVTTGLTKQMLMTGRDAGADEFLNRPISPAALKQRLEMVTETPRPFVDCAIYLGPCRRRKNPADYYGEKRRAGERVAERKPMVDQDELAMETPMRKILTQLRQTCGHLRASRPEALATANSQLKTAKDLAMEQKDHALHAGLASFEAYIGVATPLGQLDENVITTALTALEQLSVLPLTFAEARESVAIALSKAIQKKLAA